MAETLSIALPTDRMIAHIDGAIGWMIFNNPARRNAVSLQMWAAIPLILDRFEADPAVRVIVLRGEGDKAFVAGADISQFEEQRASRDAVAHYESVAAEAARRLESTDKPTIAMIRGWCIGGGVGLAADCDLRIAAEDARFGIPAARLGLGYGPAGVKRLMDLVGPANTREIFYTARHFTAAELHAMGFVSPVTPADELEPTVRATAALIADNAPLTLKALKRTVAELLRPAPDLAACEQLVQDCFASADYIEGRRAFMEKRKPVFHGR
jgi:enoyl-CoA hydratase/carnithine racemase